MHKDIKYEAKEFQDKKGKQNLSLHIHHVFNVL